MSNLSAIQATRTCYFSIIPIQSAFNDETPFCTPYSPGDKAIVADPFNPLLAYRSPPLSPSFLSVKMDASKFLQMQTQAAHPVHIDRPQPRPLQNVLAVSDDCAESPSSESSSMEYPLSQSPEETARCSRCQRTTSFDLTTRKPSNMVSYGLNLYYCTRCAKIVGFHNR
ncbi:hypothetical protein MBLNU459_g4874t1 [Dothideomycetes sp. NU459]